MAAAAEGVSVSALASAAVAAAVLSVPSWSRLPQARRLLAVVGRPPPVRLRLPSSNPLTRAMTLGPGGGTTRRTVAALQDTSRGGQGGRPGRLR